MQADETIAALEAEVKALQIASDLAGTGDAAPAGLSPSPSYDSPYGNGSQGGRDYALQHRLEAAEREREALQAQLDQALGALRSEREQGALATQAAVQAAVAAALEDEAARRKASGVPAVAPGGDESLNAGARGSGGSDGGEGLRALQLEVQRVKEDMEREKAGSMRERVDLQGRLGAMAESLRKAEGERGRAEEELASLRQQLKVWGGLSASLACARALVLPSLLAFLLSHCKRRLFSVVLWFCPNPYSLVLAGTLSTCACGPFPHHSCTCA